MCIVYVCVCACLRDTIVREMKITMVRKRGQYPALRLVKASASANFDFVCVCVCTMNYARFTQHFLAYQFGKLVEVCVCVYVCVCVCVCVFVCVCMCVCMCV